MNFLASIAVPWWMMKWACASAARCLSVSPTNLFFLRDLSGFLRFAFEFCPAFILKSRFHACCVCCTVTSDWGCWAVLWSTWVLLGDDEMGAVAGTAGCCAADGGLLGHREHFAPVLPIDSASFFHNFLFAATYFICDSV